MDDGIVARAAGFWTTNRILFALVFIFGIILGGILVNQYIDPFIYANRASDYNAVSELNNRLDSRADELYNCLVKNEISPSSCVVGAQAVQEAAVQGSDVPP